MEPPVSLCSGAHPAGAPSSGLRPQTSDRRVVWDFVAVLVQNYIECHTPLVIEWRAFEILPTQWRLAPTRLLCASCSDLSPARAPGTDHGHRRGGGRGGQVRDADAGRREDAGPRARGCPLGMELGSLVYMRISDVVSELFYTLYSVEEGIFSAPGTIYNLHSVKNVSCILCT